MIARFHLTAPLSHSSFGADAGNALPLRRMPIVSLPGHPDVPVVSGNAVRGQLRRLLARELFAATEISPESAGAAWDKLYAAVANGGTIEAAEKRLDPERIRYFRERLPMLSVLGAALYKWLLSGHVRVGIAWPVCRETVAARLVTAPDGEAPVAGELETEYSASRLPDAEHQSPEVTGVNPMPVVIEVLSTGTVLESRIGFASHASDVERSAISHGLTLVTHLGGKSASGLGACTVEVVGDVDPGPYRAWGADSEALAAARVALLDELPETW